MPAEPPGGAFTVRQATDAELDELLALRERVFCGEQGVSRDAELDGRDGDATHVVAHARGSVVGTCRLLMDGDTARLGRMAVEAPWRRRGVGTALLAEAERVAALRGARRIALHAQLSAEALYARNGYRSGAERFIEEGMEHVAMDKTLA